MSSPDQTVPPPALRILPHVPLTEQGLRELELWLRQRLGSGTSGGGNGLQYHKATKYGADNEGDWLFAAANDAAGSPGVSYTDQEGGTYANGFAFQFDTGSSDAPNAFTGDGGFLVDTAGTVNVEAGSSAHIWSSGDVTATSVSGAVTVGANNITLNGRGGTVEVTGTGTFEVDETGVNLFASDIVIDAHGGLPNGITMRGVTVLKLSTAGDTFTVYDHSDVAIVTVTG